MKKLEWIAVGLVAGALGCGSDAGTSGSSSAAAASGSSKPAAAATSVKPADSSTSATKPAGPAAEETVDKVMVECTWTKGFAKNSFGEEQLEYEVKNVSGQDLNYVQFNMYFYDASGKQLKENSSSSQNGQPWLKAGETKKAALSPEKAKMPAGTETVECEVSAGADTANKKWRNPKMGHYDRPKGGVK